MKEEDFVKECPHFQDCGKGSDSTCRGCNTWIAKYHIERLEPKAFNNMFDCFCACSKEMEHVTMGNNCMFEDNQKCGLGCECFRYAKNTRSK